MTPKRIISPKKFIEGGAPILITQNKNHQKVKDGNIKDKPFNRTILRVKNRS